MLTNSNTPLELYAPFARNTIEVASKRPLMVKHQKKRWLYGSDNHSYS